MEPKVIGEIVECSCGETHTLESGSVSIYTSSGCDSCGYGSSIEYSWKCPTMNKWVSYSRET